MAEQTAQWFLKVLPITTASFMDSRISRGTKRGNVDQNSEWKQTNVLKDASANVWVCISYHHHKDPELNLCISAIQILFLSALPKKKNLQEILCETANPFVMQTIPSLEITMRENFNEKVEGNAAAAKSHKISRWSHFSRSAVPRISLRNVRHQLDCNWIFQGPEGNVKSSSYSGIDTSKERVHLAMMLSLYS